MPDKAQSAVSLCMHANAACRRNTQPAGGGLRKTSVALRDDLGAREPAGRQPAAHAGKQGLRFVRARSPPLPCRILGHRRPHRMGYQASGPDRALPGGRFRWRRRAAGVTVVATSYQTPQTVPCPAASGSASAVRGYRHSRAHPAGAERVAILSHGDLARFVRPRPSGAAMGLHRHRGTTPVRVPQSMRSPLCYESSAVAGIRTGRAEKAKKPQLRA